MPRYSKTMLALVAALMASTAVTPANAKLRVKVKLDVRKPFQPPVQVHVSGNGIVGNAINTLQQVHNNVAREAGNITQHAAKETRNLGENIVEAVETTGKYLEDRAASTKEMTEAFGRRVREGKFVDALWHSQTDTLKGENKDLAKAMQRSSVLRTGGQVAASFYGGPAGSAAFTVWLTYNATGSFEHALKAGAISYAASYSGNAINTPGPLTFDRIVANTATNGVISGAVMAAGGGDFKTGAINGMAAYAANVAYMVYTTAPLDMRPGSEPYCKGYVQVLGPAPGCAPPREWNGDIRQLDHRRNHVGKFAETAHPSNPTQEGSTLMRAVNKAPGMNAMAYLHDTASVDFKFPVGVNEVTILPAVIATYYANGAGRDRELLDAATKGRPEQR